MKNNRKIVAVILVCALLCSVLNISAFSQTDNESSIETNNVASNESYKKLHFYFGGGEYANVDSVNEVVAATTNLKATKNVNNTSVLLRTNTNETEDNCVDMTVQFNSSMSSTKEYKQLMNEREELHTVAEKRDLRERLNAFAKQYHSELLRKNMDSLSDIEYESFDHIEYSPFVVMKINTKNIEAASLLDLSKDAAIAHISLSDNLDAEEDSSTSYTTVSSTWDQMLTAINASGVVNSGTYTGEGIKVGILEANGVCNTTHANLADKDITIENSSSTISDHATNVTSIVALMAPDAEYYVSYAPVGVSVTQKLSWFVDRGCDVLNCSFGLPVVSKIDGVYHENVNYVGYRMDYDSVFEYYVEMRMITIVCSAGNVSNDNTTSKYNPNGRITSPGNAYNVITVGGVNRVSSSTNQVAHATGACYNSGLLTKPTVSAIFSLRVPNITNSNGGPIISGTSYAAPQVTALIALLLEIRPEYIDYPEKVTAVILASANTTYGYEPNWDYVHHDEKVGAGIVNLTRMMAGNINRTGYISNDSSNIEVMSKRISLQAGMNIQIGLSWLIGTNAITDNYGQVSSLTEIYVTDYDLFLYDSDGNIVASSETADCSTEMIRYTVTVSDVYDIVVYQYGSIDDDNDGDFMCMTYNLSS